MLVIIKTSTTLGAPSYANFSRNYQLMFPYLLSLFTLYSETSVIVEDNATELARRSAIPSFPGYACFVFATRIDHLLTR